MIIASNSTMVGENYENLGHKIPKNTMKTHKICKLDRITAFNSTIVGEIFEKIRPQIPRNTMKTHTALTKFSGVTHSWTFQKCSKIPRLFQDFLGQNQIP